MVSTLLARAARWRLSDTSRNCSIEVPTPSATGHQLHGWGQWEREGQGGGGGEGCLLLRQKPRLWSCWSNEMQRVLSLGSGWGRGFWGVTTSPEEKERPCQCPPPQRRGSYLGPCAYGQQRQGQWTRASSAGGTRAGGSWDARGHQTPREVPSRHPPSTLSHLPALLCIETAACRPLHTLGLRVRWLGAWGYRGQQSHTLGVAQDTGTQDRRKTPGSPSNNQDLLGAAPHAR